MSSKTNKIQITGHLRTLMRMAQAYSKNLQLGEGHLGKTFESQWPVIPRMHQDQVRDTGSSPLSALGSLGMMPASGTQALQSLWDEAASHQPIASKFMSSESSRSELRHCGERLISGSHFPLPLKSHSRNWERSLSFQGILGQMHSVEWNLKKKKKIKIPVVGISHWFPVTPLFLQVLRIL